ncbi:tyrosine recombinase XerC [Rhodobiaceae bacterium]|nr:tyrosine recombinase XerC [Rhodobiaceae bacterium]
MGMPKRQKNPNHPKKGSTIKVEPIRDLRDIKRIKKRLVDMPRDLCLFTIGINTAYRASELLSIRVGDVAHLGVGDRFELKQQKTKKYRATTFNQLVVNAIQSWIAVHPDPRPQSPLFVSRKRGSALTVSTITNMVKDWCDTAGMKGNFGSHSLRKTWGYHQRVQNRAAVPLLMEAFGHATQQQTLEYLCIQSEEIQELYALEL